MPSPETTAMIRAMNFLLVGYGRMGKEVEAVCADRNHRIVAKVDPLTGNREEITAKAAADADCAVEFSSPDAVIGNARLYAGFGLNAVVGTTGCYDELETVKKIVGGRRTGYLYGSNFSIGAQLFFHLIAVAVKMVNPFPEYDIAGFEAHHRRKKDAPSGTAKEIARIILENSRRKSSLLGGIPDRDIRDDELHFPSMRVGEFPGLHKVFLDSAADTIELTHTARNRSGFALGAVLAAEWMKDRKGFYKVDDFINDLLAGKKSRGGFDV